MFGKVSVKEQDTDQVGLNVEHVKYYLFLRQSNTMCSASIVPLVFLIFYFGSH